MAKYSGNFETVANLFYRGRDVESLIEFTRRLAFSYAVGNSHSHLKKRSLIYPDGRVPKISPAYDLVSVIAYEYLGINVAPALRLANRARYADVSIDAFERMGKKVSAPIDLRDVVRDTVRRMRSNIDSFEEDLRQTGRVDEVREHFSAMELRLG
jgi:serine/threonine-protein kinase HipA